MIKLFNYNLTPAPSMALLAAAPLLLVLAAALHTSPSAPVAGTGSGRVEAEAARANSAQVRDVFASGFQFATYAQFERFFHHKLPLYQQQKSALRRQIALSRQFAAIAAKQEPPSGGDVTTPIQEDQAGPRAGTEAELEAELEADTRLMESPVYVYALNELDLEPVRRLYSLHHRSGRPVLEALNELNERLEADPLFKQIAFPVVAGLVKVIVVNQLQLLGTQLVATISSDSYDSLVAPAGSPRPGPELKQVSVAGRHDALKLKPQVERMRREMCQLLSQDDDEQGQFDCDNIQHLRDFLNMEANKRDTLAKVSRYSLLAYQRHLEASLHQEEARDKQQQQANRAPSAVQVIQQRNQPHRQFASQCQTLLDPVFGIYDHALLDFIYQGVDDSASRVRDRIMKLLNDHSDNIINYWYQVYHVCKLVNLVNFDRH